MQNVNEIASYSRRLESLHFGVADYAASLKQDYSNWGTKPKLSCQHKDGDNPREKHWGDMWHHAVSNGNCCKSKRFAPDGPFGEPMIQMDT